MRRYFFRLLLMAGDLFAYVLSFFVILSFFTVLSYTPQLLIINGLIFFVFMIIEETYSLREEDYVKKSFYILKGVIFSCFVTFLFVYNTTEKFYPMLFIVIWYLLLYFFIISIRYAIERAAVKWNIYFRKTLLIVSDNYEKKVFKKIFSKGYSRINRVKRARKYQKILEMTDDELDDMIEKYNISQVIIFSRNMSFKTLMKLEEKIEGKVYFIKIIPAFNQIQLAEMEVININENLVLETRQKLLSPYRMLLKRVMDIILGIFFLILFSPVMILVALAIKIESPGPVLFKQKRLGRKKSIFYAWKFRSMYKDAEGRLNGLLEENPEMKAEYEKYAKISNDPRVTKVGRIIRKLSIDELPQFFNVFFGSMSVMGPRPYLVSELEKMGYKANIILAAKPGITGLWQTRGRNEMTFDERVSLESYYVKNWSLWGDIVILFETPCAVLLKRKTG
ncbi:MAG: exopolysaccharide biosynthesis polyprenyl glycosylphosphotransferase [Candidatus Muiribacteriota bacterium]